MGGDRSRNRKADPHLRLNPPRPHGRGRYIRILPLAIAQLKSTPPAWAGTSRCNTCDNPVLSLKSTPPAWAGTGEVLEPETVPGLKSTPPAWAGTNQAPRLSEPVSSLNPPRPRGRGRCEVIDMMETTEA